MIAGQRATELVRMVLQGRSFSGNERNCVFLNVEGEQFATVSAVSGLDFPDDGRALSLVDWDQDGDLDMWISNRNAPRVRFMRNDSTKANRFIAFRLEGNGTSTNRDAIGARVELVSAALAGRPMIKSLRAGEGFLAQSTKWLYFGLGEIESIDKVVIYWPDGTTEEVSGVQINQRYQVVQGSGQAVEVTAPNRKLALQADDKKLAPDPPPSQVRVPMVTMLPMPYTVEYQDFDDRSRELSFEKGSKTRLIVLWASWCAPCLKELTELVERREELANANIEVVALTVDGLGDERAEPNAARKICERIKFPYVSGKATEDFVQLMTGYHHQVVVLKELLPVPSSFLIDPEGRLTFIYKGRIDVDQVIADAQTSPTSIKERLVRSAPLPGRMIDDSRMLTSQIRSEAKTLTAMGNAFATGGRYREATRLFESALESESEYAAAHAGLARAYVANEQFEAAIVEFRRAIDLEPNDTTTHTALAKAHRTLGNLDDALAHLAEAVQIEPLNWEAEAEWGQILLAKKHYDDAKSHLSRALDLNPSLESARESLRIVQAILIQQ